MARVVDLCLGDPAHVYGVMLAYHGRGGLKRVWRCFETGAPRQGERAEGEGRQTDCLCAFYLRQDVDDALSFMVAIPGRLGTSSK